LLSLLVLSLFVGVAAIAFTSSEVSAQQPHFAILTGAAEVPGPGDPDGVGGATVTLNTTTGQVCTNIGVARIAPATAAHIHRGTADVAGPVVVDFTGLLIPGLSVATGCVMANPMLVAEIAANPSGFYVNVHNADFPNGAVRGQLN
jgi:hypothetical protein